MKKLITLVILMMSVGVNRVSAQNLAIVIAIRPIQLEQTFLWLYVLLIIAIGIVIILQKIENRILAGLLILIVAYSFIKLVTIVWFSDMYVGYFAVIFTVISFLLAVVNAVFVFEGTFTVGQSRKTKKIFSFGYYICAIIAMLCIYYQI